MFENQSQGKAQSQEISTEYSLSERYGHASDKGSYGLYDNYSWIKDRLLVQYEKLGGHQVVKKIQTSIKPVVIQISDEGTRIGNRIDKVRQEFNNLRKQTPKLSEIAKIDFASLLKAKYKSLF